MPLVWRTYGLNKINVAVFTSIRSEYGSLKPLLKSIKDDDEFSLKLLVGGAHLLKDFGSTINEIIDDGFEADQLFPFLFTDMGSDALTRSVAVLANQISSYLADRRPDLLLIIGDRFELLPVVNAALILNIPIAHISGGEITEGAIDNQVRHAISKMSSLHFVATEEFKNNLLKMAEEEWRICVCGELGLDQVLSMGYFSKKDLYNELGLDVERPVICATLHTETIDNQITPEFVGNLYTAIIKESDFQILATAANFDEGGSQINDMLEKLSSLNPKISFIKSLGKKRYFSLLQHCDLVLGNSSSGLVEVQSFNKPVINIGKRQAGRLSNPNVLHIDVDTGKIIKGITEVLSSDFKAAYNGKPNVYGKGDVADTIMEFIKQNIGKDLLIKRMPV